MVEALREANLKVGRGQIVTVIGPNGAGKTTLLSGIMGLLPRRGELVFDGERQKEAKVEHLVSKGLTLMPEKRELFASMSVEANLMLGAFQPATAAANATSAKPWNKSTRASRGSRNGARS